MLRVLSWVLACTALVAADFPVPFNTEPIPGGPMPAAEAAAQWRVPEGFKVSVFAAEPDIQNPVACTWDPRGRLWVVENYTYGETSFADTLRDRVLVFEGTGTDHFTRRSIFTDDYQHLTSVEVGQGGVWLLAVPQLLFIPDKDGDAQPDGPAQVVLDGFTVPRESYHNFANGLRWGPDGWLYGRCGASAPGRIGAPGTTDAERIPLAGTLWRYHPTKKIFEVLSSGTTNPWGHDWNAAGDCFFVNTVNGHLWQMLPGAHYVRPHTLDPHPFSYELIDLHADHWHFDTAKGWQASRDGKADDLGGGHAHCGAMIYLGDNWPDRYRGKLFTLNFHGRRMNIERLERDGSGYLGRHDGDAFFSPDPWFRGIDLTYGPDGGVFVLDWSDAGECHERTGVHRTSGRIFKITYSPSQPASAAPGDLSQLSDAELTKLHEHKNEWFPRTARRVLADRAESKPSPDHYEGLRTLLATSQDPAVRLRALYTLHAVGAIVPEFLTSLLRDPDENIRACAVRLLLDLSPLDRVDGSGIRATGTAGPLPELASRETSASVRLALASALQRLPLEERAALATPLVRSRADAGDHNLPLLIWYGLAPLGEKHPETLVDLARQCELPTTRRLIARRLASDLEKRPQPVADLLTAAIGQAPAEQADLLSGLSQAFTGWRRAPKPTSWDRFVAAIPAGDKALQDRVRDLSALFGDGRALDEVKRIALDKTAPLDARKAALRTLIDARPDDLRTLCEPLLGERFLNTVAARGLALSDDPAIGVKLARSYRSFHQSERPMLLDTLVSRPTFARALLEEVAAGKIPREELTAFHARQIRSFDDPAITRRLGQVWGELRESSEDKRAQIAKFRTQLTPAVLASADKAAGRVLFESVCATCHTLYGHGGKIGPDLTGSGRANLDYLLENILDPSAVVNADFRLHIVTLKDGRVVNGMISAQTDRTITYRTMTEPVTIERAEITKDEELPISLMPEGLLLAYSADQVRDLLAYLMHPVQVPLPGAK